MDDIKEVAIATWRLEKWLNNTIIDKKMPAKSSIRTINTFLKNHGIEVQDITGSHFDIGLNVDVLNNEAPDADNSELIIIEMVKPIILQEGAVISRGSVILGTSLKENTKSTNEIDDSKPDTDEKVECEIEKETETTSVHPNLAGVKDFCKNSWVTMSSACKNVETDIRSGNFFKSIRQNFVWIYRMIILLLMFIIFLKVSDINKKVTVFTSPGVDAEISKTDEQRSTLPDGVSIAEDEERNLYITINNK